MAESDNAAMTMVETVVDGMVEEFWKKLDTWSTHFTDRGRPLFAHRLSPDEQIEEFMDDMLRERRLEVILQHEGPVAAVAWRDRMQDMMRKRMADGAMPGQDSNG